MLGLGWKRSSSVHPTRNAHSICGQPPYVNELPEDFRDLLVELADVGAEFVLVGGHAVAFHGHPRATKDMDVLIRANTMNAERVYRALAGFGAPLEAFQVKAEDFATNNGVLQIGLPPRRIDVLNRADGITFDVWSESFRPPRNTRWSKPWSRSTSARRPQRDTSRSGPVATVR